MNQIKQLKERQESIGRKIQSCLSHEMEDLMIEWFDLKKSIAALELQQFRKHYYASHILVEAIEDMTNGKFILSSDADSLLRRFNKAKEL